MRKKFTPKSEIILMCGIPGIGKSCVVENFSPYHHRVNLDSIHEMLAPGIGFDKRNLGLGRNIEDLIIKGRLKKRIPIVIDNTNITKEKREKYIKFAEENKVDISAVYFEPDAKLAISQNSKRLKKVPKIAIYKMAKDFQTPLIEEGFKGIYSVENIGKIFGDKKAVFLDRDGVITKTKINGKDHFVNKVSDILLYDKAVESVKKFSEKGYKVFIISNQAGVAYGKMSETDLEDINSHLLDLFSKKKVNISDIYCCIHSKTSNCRCRKPKTGMIIQAAYEYAVDLKSSYIVGDMTTDIEVGKRIGLNTILVETGFAGSDGRHDSVPDNIVKDIYSASEIV